MKARWTWLLTGGALLLALYTYWTEPDGGVRVAGTRGASAYVPVRASDVTAVEFVRSNAVLRVERVGNDWRMREPVNYPAQTTAIEALLTALEHLQPQRWMSLKEVGGSESLKAFGLEGEAATLRVDARSGRWEIRVGSLTPLGSQFYFQRSGTDGIFTADGKILELLPFSPSNWRDRRLVEPLDSVINHLVLQRKTPLEAQLDPVTQQWRLIRPLAARANSDRINGLISTLRLAPVSAFVSDSPLADLETFGLQPPEAEITLSAENRILAQLQFGRAPTNIPGQMYVRRMSHTNVVLVPAALSVLLQAPLTEFRDRRLIVPDAEVSHLEILFGKQKSVADRIGNDWLLSAPVQAVADPREVDAFFKNLGALRIQEFPSDVVADYGQYGLNSPALTIRLTTGTNPPIEVQWSATTGGKTIYSRRLDEPGVVYELAAKGVDILPRTAAQLRLISFGATNLSRITIHQGGRERILGRNADGTWKVIAGAPGNLLAPALDEIVHRLGHLENSRWPVPDESLLTNLPSARELDHELIFSFADGAPVRTVRWQILTVDDAAAVVLIHLDNDPTPMGSQIPRAVYDDLSRELNAP